jgi:hypothetical protein
VSLKVGFDVWRERNNHFHARSRTEDLTPEDPNTRHFSRWPLISCANWLNFSKQERRGNTGVSTKIVISSHTFGATQGSKNFPEI